MYNIHVYIYIATAKAKVETAKMLHALQVRQAEFEEKLIEKKELALKKEDDMRQEKAGVSHDMNSVCACVGAYADFILVGCVCVYRHAV